MIIILVSSRFLAADTIGGISTLEKDCMRSAALTLARKQRGRDEALGKHRHNLHVRASSNRSGRASRELLTRL